MALAKEKNKSKCLALGKAEAQTNNCILFNSHLSGDFVCTVLKALLQCSATILRLKDINCRISEQFGLRP